MISQKECNEILRYALETGYFDISFAKINKKSVSGIKIKFVDRLQSFKIEDRDGLKNLVQFGDRGYTASATITLTKAGRKTLGRVFYNIYHELYHIYQIDRGFLRFKGHSIFYHNTEHKLRHIVDGMSTPKGHYSRYQQHYIPPWEDFLYFVANMAKAHCKLWKQQKNLMVYHGDKQYTSRGKNEKVKIQKEITSKAQRKKNQAS